MQSSVDMSFNNSFNENMYVSLKGSMTRRETIAFNDAKVRDTLYNTMLHKQRAQLHKSVCPPSPPRRARASLTP